MSPDRHDREPGHRLTAWVLVALQLALIALIVLLPDRVDWVVPSWLRLAGTVSNALGLVVMLVAGLTLRRGLTAAPLPNAHAKLRTGGLYRLVRHPVYTGLLLFAAAQVVTSGSLVVAFAGLLLVVLLNVKARWEEERLTERFPGYGEYARRTPRFVPWPAGAAGRIRHRLPPP